jgi:large subunit ribosomal protein L13
MKKRTEEIYIIDAKDQILGRIASKVAFLLQGKQKSDFSPNTIENTLIEIKNISKMKFKGNKLTNKKYYRHSGYPGGLKSASLGTLFESKPELIFKNVVSDMLPKNRNRQKLINRLKLSR